MEKKYYIAVALAALIITTAGVSFIANASEGQWFQGDRLHMTDQMKAQMDEVRDLRQNGDFETAQAKVEEYNLPMFHGKADHSMKGNNEFMTAVRKALDNNDYQAWVTAHQGMEDKHPNMLEDLNEENFNKMVQVHTLMVDGDYESARALAEELGLEHFGPKKGFGKGNRIVDRNYQCEN